MKKFNLTEMGLKEMTRSEMVETEGGIIWFLVAAVAVAIASSGCSNCSGEATIGVNADVTLKWGANNSIEQDTATRN